MDTEPRPTVSTADTSKETEKKSTEPVKIKTEAFDPDYTSAHDDFNTTAQILATSIKSETKIKKEIKEEPMDASESANQTKMPLPIPLQKVPKKEKRKVQVKETLATPFNYAKMRILGKTKMGIKQRTLIHEKGIKQRTMVYERAPASNSGYYPPASVIWQRVPYLKPKRTKMHPKYNPYKWKASKNKSNQSARRDSPQSNLDHLMNQPFADNEQDSPSDDNDNENPRSNSTDTSSKAYFYLNVSEFPKTWTEEQIKEFLENECVPVKDFEMEKDMESNFLGNIFIEFDTFEQRKEVQEKLNGKIVDGKALTAVIIEASEDNSDSDSECSEPSVKRSKSNLDPAYKADVDVWEKDPKGLYGLKPEFLQSLGITPPIDRWVQVTNFRCDKSELKDILELAGQVLLCTVLTINHKTAKVMYSHPLEAVQAVSMLNNQTFYGQSLKVTMENCLDRQIVLPKGLLAVGPGLGQNGVTLRDIVRHYERYAKGRTSSINSNIFREINFKTDAPGQSTFSDIGSVQPKTEPDAENSQNVGPIVPNPCNPKVNPNITNAEPSGSMPGSIGPMPGPSGPMPGPSGMMSGPSGPMPGPRGLMPGPNSPRPVNGGPVHNQMRSNIPVPMPHQMGPMPGPTRPGFCSNPMQAPMMGQGNRIPRQTGPMPGPMGPGHGQIGPGPGQMGPAPGPMGPGPGQMGPGSGPMGPGPGQFQRPGAPRPFHVPTSSNIPGPMQNQPGWFPNRPQQGMPGNRPPGPMGPPGPNQGHLRPANNVPARTMNSANCPGPIPQSQKNCTVEISNIPTNTTFTFLAEKLATCGQMMSLQLTCDRAIAQFATRGHAENCYKQFNKLKVCDNILQVKFI